MARDFQGVTDHYDRIDWDSVTDLTAHALTISVWLTLDELRATQYILCIHDSGDTYPGLYFFQSNSTLGYGVFNITGSTGGSYYCASGTMVAGSLMHLLVTWDGTNGSSAVSFYKNGTYATTYRDVILAGETTHSGRWSVGGRYYDDARNLNGRMAFVGVWNRVVSSDERTGLAAGNSPQMYPSGLIFYSLNGSVTKNYVTGTAASVIDGTTVTDDPYQVHPIGVSSAITLNEGIDVYREAGVTDLSVSIDPSNPAYIMAGVRVVNGD